MTDTLWITGVAGFSGRHLVGFLKEQPKRPRVVGLDTADAPPEGIDAFHRVDLSKSEEVAALARRDSPARVIHLAAVMPPASEEKMWYTNIACTVSLLHGLASGGCSGCRVVSIGSAAEYLSGSDNALTESSPCGGLSIYGRVKWSQSVLAISLGKQLGLSAMVARPFNLIGPGLSTNLVAGWLCEQFAASVEEIEIGNTQSARDFVDIRDAVVAYWLLAEKGEAGEVYNVCTGQYHTIEKVLSLLGELTGRSPKTRTVRSRLRDQDSSVCFGDYGKIHRATGWQPKIGLKESLKAMLDYLSRSH